MLISLWVLNVASIGLGLFIQSSFMPEQQPDWWGSLIAFAICLGLVFQLIWQFGTSQYATLEELRAARDNLEGLVAQRTEALLEANSHLVHDALHDALTGLPNRVLFQNRLEQAMRVSKRRSDQDFALLFLDLDGFKIINDSLGHLVGDELLIMVAARLAAGLRPSDTVARLGGDEFAILIDEYATPGDLEQIAERLRMNVAQPYLIEGHEIVVDASIGIAVSSTGYELPQDMLRDADTAMYRAKARGKGHCVLFDTTMHTRAVRRLSLEHELRKALELEQFEVHYQPIVYLASGELMGVEALIRWRHPEKGFIAPGEFLPIAEETGLILPIGAWILREACGQLARWPGVRSGERALTLSVNLSNKQFWHPTLVAQLQDVLAETQLEAKYLKLEVTEDVVMAQSEQASAILEQLCRLGLDVLIDDFGTGYSSLESLHRFSIQGLKIPRGFVKEICHDRRSAELVRGIVAMAKALGLDVVSEGIETSEQAALLQAMGCPLGQGFLFARPMSAEACLDWLSQHSLPQAA
jgi:diguanylate cyclase (GGDEF)-like protein